MNRLALAFRFARREMRSGLSGFRIFFACLVLGVAAIAAVGSLSQAFFSGLAEQGRVLLGGDVAVSLVHRETTPAEHAFMARYGRVSETVSMRGMAYAIRDGAEAERQLVELKAVDDGFPLYGREILSPNVPLNKALACDATLCGAAVEDTLLDRLKVKRGDILRVGVQNFRIAAVIQSEPDRISGGFSLGPHLLISDAGLKRTGLVVLGSLITYSYRIAAHPGFDAKAFKTAATDAFPDAGWEIRDTTDPAPGFKRFLEEVTMFLTLVGLTALAVGGVGAGQAVTAFLEKKRNEIATLKSLGADGGLVFQIFFLQVMSIAVAAVGGGLLLGAAIPYAVQWAYGANLPVPADFGFYGQPLLLAALFGILSAAVFAIPPLARTRLIAPASLFRDVVALARAHAQWRYLCVAAALAAAIVALTLLISPSPVFAAEFLGGVAIGLGALRLVAGGLRWLLKKSPRPRNTVLRLALANLTRPGAATAGVVTALGLGLTLLCTVTLLDRTVTDQVADRLPARAPSFFFVDVQPDEAAAFDKTILGFNSAADYRRTPMIRGRITALNGTPARDAKVSSDVKWALSGDRGITYAATPPKDTVITGGQWWPANYTGPTQISFDGELAPGLGLKLGDTLTVNVLGREITGKITSFRKVDFSNGNQNFVLILSPGLIDHAPHSFLATVRVSDKDEEPLYRAVTSKFQNISTVRVKDAIAQVNGMLQELSDGVRAASVVTILAGLLVLAGAIAAGQRARLYDSTVLKVLGATRSHIAAVYALEYGLLGFVTGVLALGVGTLAASLVANQVLEVPLVFDAGAALLTVGGGMLATLVFGLIGAWAALAARPASLLRAP
ncbi:MAG TPA: FtsX-like permease family protein [Rhizomicrobium sp.]|jgi:putative ABC transport system permease protein